MSQTDKERVRRAISERRGWSLIGWGERAAVLAVRRAAPELVTLGLVALSLADVGDDREVLRRVPLLTRAARLIGADAAELLRAAADRADDEGRAWLLKLVDSNIQPSQMGYAERGEGESFDFYRTESIPNRLLEEMRAWRAAQGD